MAGSVASDSTVTSGTGFTTNRSGGQTYIYFDKDIDESYTVNVSNVQFGDQYIRALTVGAKAADGFKVYAYYDGAGQPLVSFDFTVTGTETIAVGGGSGSGGKTVAFRGELSANLTGLTTVTWTKINLNTTSIDTDNALVDGKFKPSVAGYYQVNGGVRESCSPVSTLTVASIYKNGLLVTIGNYGLMDESTNGSVNDIFYLDGKDDYLELFGQVKSSGTCGIESASKDTFLSAVLVSGGSGDSIWTEEDGDAVLEDGFVKVKRDGQEINITPSYGGVGGNSIIETDDNPIGLMSNSKLGLTIQTNGKVYMPSEAAWSTSASASPNIFVNPDTGELIKTTTTYYSTQDVDKMLAIKDKLIEKLSARLDSLEKKVN